MASIVISAKLNADLPEEQELLALLPSEGRSDLIKRALRFYLEYGHRPESVPVMEAGYTPVVQASMTIDYQALAGALASAFSPLFSGIQVSASGLPESAPHVSKSDPLALQMAGMAKTIERSAMRLAVTS